MQVSKLPTLEQLVGPAALTSTLKFGKATGKPLTRAQLIRYINYENGGLVAKLLISDRF
jgi:hypothetical protein